MATTLSTPASPPSASAAPRQPANGYQDHGCVRCPCGHMNIHYAWQLDRRGYVDLRTSYLRYTPGVGNLAEPTERCPACRRKLTYHWLAQALEYEQATASHHFHEEDRVRTTVPLEVGVVRLPAGSPGTVDQRLPSAPPVYVVALDTPIEGRMVSLVIREDELEAL